MDSKEIKKYVEKIGQKATKIYSQEAYANGNHVAIYQPPPKSDPDYRKPLPIIRKALDFLIGYMAKPGAITYQGDYYENTLKDIYDLNDEELVNAALLEDACKHGVAYELHWMTDGVKQFYPLPVSQVCPIYSNDLKRRLIGLVWYRETDDDQEICTYYTDEYNQDFVLVNGEWMPGPEQPHGYGSVQVNEFHIGRECKNLYDHVLPLVDLIDKLLSEDIANEASRFNAAIMLMAERIDATTKDDLGSTLIDRLKELRLLDGMAPDGSDVRNKVAFVHRDIPTDFIKFAVDTIYGWIYQMLGIPNPDDDGFASASGSAQAYKLLGLEYLSTRIEAYFSRGLQNRIRLLSGLGSELMEKVDGMDKVTISWTRNLPHNMLELADTTAKLKGTLSDETIIGMFPKSVVPNVQEELDRLNAQAPEMTFDNSLDNTTDGMDNADNNPV